jgi:sugar lactone lactonase YvrE
MKLARRVVAKSTPTAAAVGAWDLDYAYYDPPAGAWDPRTARVTTTFNISAQDSTPAGLYLKPDGTNLYVVGAGNDRVNQYSIGPNHTATFVRNFSVAGQEINPTGIFFSPDGIYMYVNGQTGDDINQYTLSTAWDISTATFTRVSTASITNPEATMFGMFFRDDGLMCYTVGSTLDTVRQYSLSTAWNISTLAFVRSSSVTLSSLPVSISFDPTGIKMRVLQRVGSTSQFRSFTLSTAWNISTATLDYTLPTSPVIGGSNVTGAFFEPDGHHVWVVDGNGTQIYPYSMGSFDVTAKETDPNSISFKPDGTRMYVMGTISDSVHRYDLSTAWDSSTAVFNQSLVISDTGPRGHYFRDDGLKLYTIGTANVREHTLSTAWDISTASFIRTTNVTSTTGETLFRGIYFKPDGNTLYTTGGTRVYMYSLSTAWDVSTFTFLSSFNTGRASTNDVFFKPDGLRMFTLCTSTGTSPNTFPGLLQYSLSTAWDTSTATFTSYKATETEGLDPTGFFFRPDGTNLYTIGGSTKLFQYSLGVP